MSDLDRGHAHVARRLQVDAEIVEIDASLRIDAERFHHHPVDARIGLAQADLGGFDDMVEQRHHFGDVERAAAVLPIALAGRLLVMQPVLNLALTRVSASTISGRRSPDSSGNTSRPRTSAPSAQQFRGEQLIEGLDVDLGALEFRPGVFEMIGGIGAPDDIGGQPALGLEPGKRLERRGGEHAAKIPDYRLDHHSRRATPLENG